MSIIFILSGFLLIFGSWKLFKFSATEKGRKLFRARSVEFMGKHWVDGLSTLNGIFIATLAFVTGSILIITGIIAGSR